MFLQDASSVAREGLPYWIFYLLLCLILLLLAFIFLRDKDLHLGIETVVFGAEGVAVCPDHEGGGCRLALRRRFGFRLYRRRLGKGPAFRSAFQPDFVGDAFRARLLIVVNHLPEADPNLVA